VDFANSVRAADGSADGLRDWKDLIEFLAAAKVISRARVETLIGLERSAPQETAAAFSAALELRSGIRRCVEARASGSGIEAEWIEPINQVLRLTEGYDQVVPRGAARDGRDWKIEFVMRERRLEWLLAAIARSAAELIAQGADAPIHKCANPACILYFYDNSRTGGRRWCSMAACGNRNKVAAHARRGRRPGRHGTN
jgi:predicted RNA-binding Zn ribbon-like protein